VRTLAVVAPAELCRQRWRVAGAGADGRRACVDDDGASLALALAPALALALAPELALALALALMLAPI